MTEESRNAVLARLLRYMEVIGLVAVLKVLLGGTLLTPAVSQGVTVGTVILLGVSLLLVGDWFTTRRPFRLEEPVQASAVLTAGEEREERSAMAIAVGSDRDHSDSA